MSIQSLHGRFFAKGIRAAIAASAALALSIHCVHAQTANQLAAQQAVETILQGLHPQKTILTATPTQLVDAVQAVVSASSASLTAADIASGVLTPFSGHVRSDRNTTAGLVAAGAIQTEILLTATNTSTFSADVAAITDEVVAVNGTTGLATETLSTAGQGTVIKDALGTLSDETLAGSITASTLEAADTAAGLKLVDDSYLESLSTFSTALDTGMAGINGVKGKSTAEAGFAADAFVTGIVESGSLPNAAISTSAYQSFAETILKNVSSNTSVDEVVANAVGDSTTELSSTTNLESLAAALFSKYPTAQAKIAQGIIADVPIASGTETSRTSFLGSLIGFGTAELKDAVNITQGAVFVDPYFSAEFTQGAFNAIDGSNIITGPKTLKADAAPLATAIGTTLGQDGNALAQVAAVYGNAVASGTLPVASVNTYAGNLIAGAVKGLSSKIPTGVFNVNVGDGGTLGLTSQTTADDLTFIAEDFAAAIVQTATTANSLATVAGDKKFATEIGTLAQTVAKYAKNLDIANGGTAVDGFIAATLDNDLSTVFSGLTGPDNPLQLAEAAIKTDVESVNNAATKALITADIASSSSYPVVGPIGITETPVTDL